MLGLILLLTLFVGAPMISAVIGYASWKGWPRSFDRQMFFISFVITLAAAGFLLAYSQRLHTDLTPWRFACFESGAILFGVAGGWMVGIFLHNGSMRQSQPESRPEWIGEHRAIRPAQWALIILAANFIHLWLFFHINPDSIVLSRVAIAVHIAACLGPFWMIADWFIKKEQKQFKTWMWLFFVPWGFLWYYFEVHRFVKPGHAIPGLR